MKPLKNATAFRLTLNTLVDPELIAATIAIGNPPTPRAWPAGAGVRSLGRPVRHLARHHR